MTPEHFPVDVVMGDRSTPDPSPVTLINIFEVTQEHLAAFIEEWRQRAAIMHTKPGFISSRLHQAISDTARFQLVNVAHWDSREAWEAATANPEFQARLAALAEDTGTTISANPALYEVAVEYVDPTRA